MVHTNSGHLNSHQTIDHMFGMSSEEQISLSAVDLYLKQSTLVLMAFRRGLSLRPVKSEKEELTTSLLAGDRSTNLVIILAAAVDSPTIAGQVEIGDTVKSIFIEFNVAAQTTTNPKVFHWLVEKLPSGGTSSVPSVYDAATKSQILHRGMEMLPSDTSTVFKRVFVVRIPPRLRRMQDGSQITLNIIASSAETVNFCMIAIYKHFG